MPNFRFYLLLGLIFFSACHQDSVNIAEPSHFHGDCIILGTVTFEPKSYELDKESTLSLLEGYEKWHLSYDHLVIYSFSDQEGSRDYNYQLACKRAFTIKNVLLDQKFSDDQIILMPLGKEWEHGSLDLPLNFNKRSVLLVGVLK